MWPGPRLWVSSRFRECRSLRFLLLASRSQLALFDRTPIAPTLNLVGRAEATTTLLLPVPLRLGPQPILELTRDQFTRALHGTLRTHPGRAVQRVGGGEHVTRPRRLD